MKLHFNYIRHIFFVVILLICRITVLGQSNTPLDSLIGKDVIFPPLTTTLRSSFYTLDAVRKGQFKDKYIYHADPLGDTLSITNIEYLNPGKPKECVLIHLIHKETPIVLYLPLHYKRNQEQYFIRHYAGYDNITGTSNINDIDLIFFDKSDISNFRNKFSSDSCIFVQKIYDVEPGKYYKFIRFEFSPDDASENPYCGYYAGADFMSLWAVFEDVNKREKWIPVLHSENSHFFPFHSTQVNRYSDTTNKYLTWNKVPSYLKTKSELLSECESFYQPNLIQNLKDSILNNFVYIDPNLYQFTHQSYICLDTKGENYSFDKNRKFYISDLRPILINNDTPKYRYFLIASSDSIEKFAIPISSDFSNYIELATVKEAREEQIRLENENNARLREQELEREEREYYNSLVRKYGRTNANLISNEEIRLGFTKAMVEEAWGSPYETTTVTNYNGSVECWIYGIGTYVYFSGNKVIQIVN